MRISVYAFNHHLAQEPEISHLYLPLLLKNGEHHAAAGGLRTS